MPTYVLASTGQPIMGRITMTDPNQSANYTQLTSVTAVVADLAPEIWGAISGSSTVILLPTSATINASMSITGGGGEVEISSVACNAITTDAYTPRVVYSFIHQLSISDSKQVNATLYDRAGIIVASGAFSCFVTANVFSATAVATPGVAQYNLKLSLSAGANVTVGSRVIITKDATIA